ncbi:uncharacterized protein [Leptinotarsa decemlineata]|uniref:uncharacterized protein n=1 Tax=Leptinotarsa decemlineata TaxID=7539 RepID=UPI003D30BAD9
MCYRSFWWTVVPFTCFVCVISNPLVIRTGVVKNQGQEQDAKLYDVSHHKGIANFEGDEGFNKDDEKKFISSSNVGRYGEQNGNRKDHSDQTSFDQGSFHENGGGDVSDFEEKKAHKKGHHKTGFHNTYHKDEQGSNSSYFDDGSDEGDEYSHKTRKGSYGDAGQDSRKGGNLDSAHHMDEQERHGHYDNAGKYEKDRGNHQMYNKNKYYDDREAANRRNAANAYGMGGRYNEEKFVGRPYHDPYYNTYDRYAHNDHDVGYPKKHITIYEDPRYETRPYQNQRYEDDYIELDVRPPRRDVYRRFETRPPYEYY